LFDLISDALLQGVGRGQGVVVGGGQGHAGIVARFAFINNLLPDVQA
jgi:hypothetical protein